MLVAQLVKQTTNDPKFKSFNPAAPITKRKVRKGFSNNKNFNDCGAAVAQ
jgi:hypothetical protein